MPIVRVDVPIGTKNEVKDRLRAGIKNAIDVALDPAQKGKFPETRKWIYVSVTEAYAKIGDGLPTVTIDTRPGRPQKQKDLVASMICDVFEKEMGTRDVYVLLRTTESEDHIGAGTALPVWKPS